MTFSGFFSEVQSVRDEIASLAIGLTDVQSLVVVRRTNSVTSYLEIKPSPTIDNVSPRMVSLFGEAGITVGTNDFNVKGISSKYTADQLSGEGISFLVGADTSTGVPVGGIVCNDVMGTLDNSRSGICWDLVLTRKQNR